MKFSSSRVALGYIALSVLALALFAIPLWYGFQANVGTFRAYVPGAQMQRLVEIFHRDGPKAVAAAVESYVPSLSRDEVIVFADPQKRRLAGNLPAWPAEVPDVPGTYGLVIGLGGDASMRVVSSHVTLPGGYYLLMGRESVRFDSLVARFWYGIAGAVAIVLTLGLVFAWLLRRERGHLEALVTQRTAALRLSEERYARAMEATEAGHWEWDLVANEVFHSARFRELYGVPLEEKFASRDQWKARQPVSPGERERQERALQAAIADPAKSYDIELAFELRPGEVRWLRSRGKVFRGEDARPLRVAGATTDITAQKLAQEAQRLSEERYALAMQASGEGHWDWKIASDEFYGSSRWRELSGFAPDEKLGGRSQMLARFPFHPEDRPKYEAAAAAHFAGTTPVLRMDLRIVPHGRLRWVRFTGMCLRDAAGSPVRWAGSIMDITEQKRAEEALRSSEERYARAMEGSDAGHWDWNIVTDEMFVSERAREMLALPPGELPPGRADLMALVPQHPEDRRAMHEHVRAGIGTGNFERDYRVIPRPGEVRWLHSRAKVYKDARGAAVRMTGSLTDITERKLAEALLAGEKRVLELIARRGALDTVLDAICRVFDGLWPALRSSVTLLGAGGERLRLVAAPHLPAPFAERMAELPLAGPDSGLCGLAVSRGEAVIAQDLAADPAWERFRDLYLAHGLRACWSVPFMSEAGRPLGTFAVFSSEPRGPSARELGAIEQFGHLAAITVERKRTEEELKRSEERYSLAMEASEEGHFDWNVKTDEIFVSVHIKKVFGFSHGDSFARRGDLVARIPYHPDDVAELQAMTRDVLRGTALRHEFDYRILRDAEVRWIRARWKIFRDAAGVALRVIGVVTDNTDRKRAEQELRDSEARFRALTELSSDWYWRQDENLRFTYVSHQVVDSGKYPREWVIGKARWELPGVTPLSAGWDEHQAALAARQPFREFEYARIGRDGQTEYVSISGASILDEQGNFRGYQGVGRSITERKRAEEELKALERKLRQSQRLEAMGTLAGGIAHDFNNILGAILGYGEMALRDAAKGSRLHRDLDSIITAGERGRALVDRVLAFSRSGVGERVTVHVEKVVREALDLLSAKLPSNVTLHAKLHAGRAAMLGDPTQVHQVLMNLATNAIQAMPSGGTLRVSLDALRVDAARAPTIGSLAPAEYLVLQVADNGTGIAPEIIDRIFDPFFTTKEVGTGTGLGLSLVHGIVTELGGAIDVASTPGAGSTFTVYLPRSGEASDSFQKEEPELPRGEGQRVLVVDDEEPLVRLATRTLEELGYAPTGFTSSTAALAAFRADPQRFDALITDERMPGMSGSALIREVRGIRDRIPVVLMSGFVGGAVASRAREAGAEEVLKKPLSARDLAASLARVLHFD